MILILPSNPEYAYTGKHDGDDTSDNIDAIGLGGRIYARGGDDNIKVGSIATVVTTGSGNDRVQGGGRVSGGVRYDRRSHYKWGRRSYECHQARVRGYQWNRSCCW